MDAGPYGAYFYVQKIRKVNRIILFFYMSKPTTQLYRFAFVDNIEFDDSYNPVNKAYITKLIQSLSKNNTMYKLENGNKNDLYRILHEKYKLGALYNLEWFTKMYDMLDNEKGHYEEMKEPSVFRRIVNFMRGTRKLKPKLKPRVFYTPIKYN